MAAWLKRWDNTHVMVGNEHHTIKKNIHNSAKKYDILLKQKGFESLGSFISEKKGFCFGCGPWGPQFCTSWAEKVFFRGFCKKFQNYWIPISF